MINSLLPRRVNWRNLLRNVAENLLRDEYFHERRRARSGKMVEQFCRKRHAASTLLNAKNLEERGGDVNAQCRDNSVI